MKRRARAGVRLGAAILGLALAQAAVAYDFVLTLPQPVSMVIPFEPDAVALAAPVRDELSALLGSAGRFVGGRAVCASMATDKTGLGRASLRLIPAREAYVTDLLVRLGVARAGIFNDRRFEAEGSTGYTLWKETPGELSLILFACKRPAAPQ